MPSSILAGPPTRATIEPQEAEMALRMNVGDEHCRDTAIHDLQGRPIQPNRGLMRRLHENEHTNCNCGGTWSGNGFTKSGVKMLEHLVCSRCGYRWVG